MKIRKSKKLRKKIQLKILEYLNTQELEILDIDEYDNIDEYDEDSYTFEKLNKGHYNAVTSEYIQKYLFNNKYPIKLIKYSLMDLFFNKRIKSFICSDIGKIIFTKNYDYGGLFDDLKDFYNSYQLKRYKNEEYLLAFSKHINIVTKKRKHK